MVAAHGLVTAVEVVSFGVSVDVISLGLHSLVGFVYAQISDGVCVDNFRLDSLLSRIARDIFIIVVVVLLLLLLFL